MTEAMKAVHRMLLIMQDKFPFFSYLSMLLEIVETELVPTIAVNNKGQLLYNPEYFLSMTEEQRLFLGLHEVMHIILDHVNMENKYHAHLIGLAIDVVVDDIILTDKPSLRAHYSKDWPTLTDASHTWETGLRDKSGQLLVIRDVHRKTAVEIYYELESNLPPMPKFVLKMAQPGVGKEKKPNGEEDQSSKQQPGTEYIPGIPRPKDEHYAPIEDDNGSAGIKKYSKEWWEDRIHEAKQFAVAKGNVTGFVEKLVEELSEHRVDWREQLYSEITDPINEDFTYFPPRKKLLASGRYFPSMIGDRLEAIIHLDSSGSCVDLIEPFVSELAGIFQQFDAVQLTVYIGDTEEKSCYHFTKTDEFSFHQEMKVRGFGGTSHQWIVERLRDKHPDASLFITFTDGESDIEECFQDINPATKVVIALPSRFRNNEEELSEYGSVVIID